MFYLCRLMERKGFYYANCFNWSLTSPVILDTLAAIGLQVKCSLFFPGFWKWAHKEEKTSLSVSVLDSKTKEDDKIVLRRVGLEICRGRQAAPFFLQSCVIMELQWRSGSLGITLGRATLPPLQRLFQGDLNVRQSIRILYEIKRN